MADIPMNSLAPRPMASTVIEPVLTLGAAVAVAGAGFAAGYVYGEVVD